VIRRVQLNGQLNEQILLKIVDYCMLLIAKTMYGSLTEINYKAVAFSCQKIWRCGRKALTLHSLLRNNAAKEQGLQKQGLENL
jgi:hypothetical protein